MNRKLILLVLVILTVLPLVVASAQEDRPRYVFVTHDLGAGVFAPVRKGMEDACAQVGADCEFLGPTTYNPSEHVSILESVIATQPDGIGTTRPEPGTYDRVLQQAVDAGIPVVTFNTNDPTANESLPLPFVGQNFTNYGQVWARETIKAMPDGGRIAITLCCPGHYALEERIRSFRETLEAEAPGKFEVVQVINTTADVPTVASSIEAFYQANPDIDAIVGSDFFTGVIAEWANANNLQNEFVIGGEIAPGTVDGLRDGYVAYGLGQGPYLQGYYPVLMLHLANTLNIQTPSIDSGTDVVTPDNLDEYDPTYR